MADPRFDREVRKELLRARAAFERVQLDFQMRELRRAARPAQVAQSLWPNLSRLLGLHGPWAAMMRATPMRPSPSASIGSLLAAIGATSGLGRRRWLPWVLAAWAGWQAWAWWHAPGTPDDEPAGEEAPSDPSPDEAGPPTPS